MKNGVIWRKFGAIVLSICIVIVLSLVSYIGVSRVFQIRSIEVIGDHVRVVVDEAKIPKNLLFFPSDQIRSKILQDNVLLADVQFRKEYPHTLVIVPILRTPFVRLKTLDRIVLLDKDGIVLQEGDQGFASLPVFQFDITTLKVGFPVSDQRVVPLLSFVSELNSFLPVDSITEIDRSSSRVKSGKTDILITQDKPLDETLATLQILMTGFRIKSKLPAVVDLRFDKPVVQF